MNDRELLGEGFQRESKNQRLVERLRAELASEMGVVRYLPRAARFENFMLCEVLENTNLSLRARGLLAFALSRTDGLTISPEVFGPDDRVGLYAAVHELEGKGFLRRSAHRWEFFAVPQPSRGDGSEAA